MNPRLAAVRRKTDGVHLRRHEAEGWLSALWSDGSFQRFESFRSFRPGQVRPLDPWILHSDVRSDLRGLGQVRPFNQDPGGWRLHGLGSGASGSWDDSAQDAALDELVASGILFPDQADMVRRGDATIEELTGAPDPSEESSWFDLVDLFREVNDDLVKLEQQFRDAATDGGAHAPYPNPDLAAFGQELTQKRAEYSERAQEFVRYYTLLFGRAPSGLSGLGVIPGGVAGAAVFLIVTFLALYALRIWARSVDVDRIRRQTESRAELAAERAEEEAKKAEARGDKAGAAQIRQQAGVFGHFGFTPPSDWSAWLQKNAKWFALAGVAMITLPAILGGRRR